MYLLFSSSVKKDELYPCEDAYQSYPEGRECKIAVVSDGASHSYNSSAWSNILVREFVKYFSDINNKILGTAVEDFDPSKSTNTETFKPIQEVLANSISQYQKEVTAPSAKEWNKLEFYEKGSFATLLAVVENEAYLDLYYLGDSLVVILSEDENGELVFETYPYKTEQEFANFPISFASNPKFNAQVFTGENSFQKRQISKLNLKYILLMTYALGAWLLVEDLKLRKQRLDKLLDLQEDWELEKLTLEERKNSSHKLKYDDTTLLVLSLQDRVKTDRNQEKVAYELSEKRTTRERKTNGNSVFSASRNQQILNSLKKAKAATRKKAKAPTRGEGLRGRRTAGLIVRPPLKDPKPFNSNLETIKDIVKYSVISLIFILVGYFGIKSFIKPKTGDETVTTETRENKGHKTKTIDVNSLNNLNNGQVDLQDGIP